MCGRLLRALWNLSDNDNNEVAMGQARVFEQIQAAMRAHPDDAELQTIACGYADMLSSLHARGCAW